jgi:pimeloyl-ACP methyl ester carboxylesterase
VKKSFLTEPINITLGGSQRPQLSTTSTLNPPQSQPSTLNNLHNVSGSNLALTDAGAQSQPSTLNNLHNLNLYAMQRLIIKLVGLGLNLWSLAAPKQAAKKAVQIFSQSPKPRVREKERQFLETARQLRRTVADQAIVEYHWGPESAPLVVLSYGWGYNAGRWRYFVPELLEAGYRVLAYDPPGHGLAPKGVLNIPANAAILRVLLEEYGPAEALAGHSFGGSSLVYALHDLPRKLHPKRMVVMASFSYAPRVFLEYKKTLGLWGPLYWSMVRGFEKRVGKPLDHYDFAIVSSAFSHIQALLVHDPNDAVTPYAEARRYHDFWPDSHLYSPKEGGHHLGTAEVTQAVLAFVLKGAIPAQAERQVRPVVAEHELVQHFAGL